MKTYVFGHKRPDTDSVCSAIAYAYLKKQLGIDAEARVLGDINLETKYVLNRFNIPEPKYLNDVKIQIKNMKYLKDAYIDENVSLEDAFNKMQELDVTGLPMIDLDKNLKGYVNLKDISRYMIHGDLYTLNTSYDNILSVLDGTSILRFDEEIKGTIITAVYKSQTFMDTVELNSNNILIVGDRLNIMEYAIKSNVKMLIIVGDFKIPAKLLLEASVKKINIINTPNLTYVASSRIRLSNYISLACNQKNPISLKTTDYRDEFMSILEKNNHTNYPVVDKSNHCVGMIRLIDQNNYEKCNCILVDHNQDSQSVDGIEEANILEVVDHHNIGIFGSNAPISFRVMPVGCTSTIIYQIYKENNIDIPNYIAGAMLSAILSDTLLFKSPTTTEMDVITAKKLAEIAKVNIEEYGLEMFKAGTSIKGLDYHDIFEQDFKTYKVDNYNVGISQIMTLNIDSINENIDKYLDILNNMDTMDYKVSLMFVTDVIKDGSYIFYNESAKEIVENTYHLDNIKQGLFLPGIISRKKQMVPKLLDYLQK